MWGDMWWRKNQMNPIYEEWPHQRAMSMHAMQYNLVGDVACLLRWVSRPFAATHPTQLPQGVRLWHRLRSLSGLFLHYQQCLVDQILASCCRALTGLACTMKAPSRKAAGDRRCGTSSLILQVSLISLILPGAFVSEEDRQFLAWISVFPAGKIADGNKGDVALDFYHRYKVNCFFSWATYVRATMFMWQYG
jgi:hypothetical protein